MEKTLSLLILLTTLTFGQSEVILFDDGLTQPYSNDALFVLDGTIKTVGANKYFDDRTDNNRDFLISGYDFDSDWTVGFPYKSAATISAPAGDSVLIAEDVNHYLYAAVDSTPNQIPVISLFQDVDYEHKLFTRHASQVLDDNLIETYQPRVLDIVLYDNVKAGNNLTTCQDYYDVPTEDATALYVAKTGNDATGNGSKTTPYLTIKKAIDIASAGQKIYVLTGEYVEARVFDFLYINKEVNVYGIGRTRLKSTNSADYIVQMTAAAIGSLNNLWFIYNSENYLISLSGSVGRIVSCNISGGDISAAIHTNIGTASVFQYTYLAGKKVFSSIENCTVNTCYLVSNSTTTNIGVSGGTATNILNSKIKTTNSGLLVNHTTGSLLTIKGCDFNITANITGIYTTNSATSSLNFSFNNLVTDKNFTDAVIVAPKVITFNDNRITLTYDFTTKTLVDFLNGTTIECYRNIISSTTANPFVPFSITQSIGTPSTTSVKLYYNKIFTKSTSAYVFKIGTESTSAFDNTISGIEIVGNYIKYTGTGQGTTHAIFVGHNVDAVIRYNYVIGLELIGYKHTGGVIASGDVSYNILKNTMLICLGAENFKVYNNTIYLDESANGSGIVISTNFGGASTNSDIRNNIIIAKNTDYVYSLESTIDTVILTFDNNILYAEDGVEVFQITGVAKTKAQWLASGYDPNSLFINPLISETTFIPSSSSPAINGGADLGTAYDDGLDITTDWGSDTETPVIVTKQQTGTWQIGAFVR